MGKVVRLTEEQLKKLITITKDKLINEQPSPPSIKDVLNPTRSKLGPVGSQNQNPVGTKPTTLPSGVPSMPSLKNTLNPTRSNLGPVQSGGQQTPVGTKPTTIPSGVPSMPSLKNTLNPTKSKLGPVGSQNQNPVSTKPTTLPSGVPSMPSIKDVLNPTKSTLGPVGGVKPGTSTSVAPAPVVQPKPKVPASDYNQINKDAVVGYGAKNSAVKSVQDKLVALKKYDLGPQGSDSIYGNNTENAVKQFQKDHGLRPDGIVGPKTKAALDAAVAGNNVTPSVDNTQGKVDGVNNTGAYGGESEYITSMTNDMPDYNNLRESIEKIKTNFKRFL